MKDLDAPCLPVASQQLQACGAISWTRAATVSTAIRKSWQVADLRCHGRNRGPSHGLASTRRTGAAEVAHTQSTWRLHHRRKLHSHICVRTIVVTCSTRRKSESENSIDSSSTRGPTPYTARPSVCCVPGFLDIRYTQYPRELQLVGDVPEGGIPDSTRPVRSTSGLNSQAGIALKIGRVHSPTFSASACSPMMDWIGQLPPRSSRICCAPHTAGAGRASRDLTRVVDALAC